MADHACGYNRQPVDPNWTTEEKQCEAAAWALFESSCPGAADPLTLATLYSQYINSRAQCLAQGESGCGCGGGAD